MAIWNSDEHEIINFTDAYTSVDGDEYALTVTIPIFSKYRFTEDSEQTTTKVEVTKTYTNTGSGISGYIIPYANDIFNNEIV